VILYFYFCSPLQMKNCNIFYDYSFSWSHWAESFRDIRTMKKQQNFEVNTWLSWLLKALNDSLSQSSVRLSPNDTGMWGNLHSAFNSRPSGVAQWLGKNSQWIVSLWKENWILIDLLWLTLNCSSGRVCLLLYFLFIDKCTSFVLV